METNNLLTQVGIDFIKHNRYLTQYQNLSEKERGMMMAFLIAGLQVHLDLLPDEWEPHWKKIQPNESDLEFWRLKVKPDGNLK